MRQIQRNSKKILQKKNFEKLKTINASEKFLILSPINNVRKFQAILRKFFRNSDEYFFHLFLSINEISKMMTIF